MKKLIILLVSLFLVLSILFVKQDNQKLGHNYYFLPLYEAIDVGFPDGALDISQHKSMFLTK